MEASAVPVGQPARQRRSLMLLGAFAAWLVANLIHNDFGLDPAVAPATVLGGLYWWRPNRPLLWATAALIAAPALLFFKWRALAEPAGAMPFLNHLALLLAGVLAIASVAMSLRSRQRGP